MLFKAGKSTVDQHIEMIYGLTRQINAQQVMLGRMARAMLDKLAADREQIIPMHERLVQVLKEIAAAGGE